jgi:phage terminase small subunit
MAKRVKIPTMQQTRFVQEYIANGGEAKSALLASGYSQLTAKDPKRILQSDGVRQELEIANKKLRAQIEIDFKYKYEKLKKIIDEYIPDTGDLIPDKVKVAITAIAEMNKMSGDYAPNKSLTLNVDHTQNKLIEARKQYKEY